MPATIDPTLGGTLNQAVRTGGAAGPSEAALAQELADIKTNQDELYARVGIPGLVELFGQDYAITATTPNTIEFKGEVTQIHSLTLDPEFEPANGQRYKVKNDQTLSADPEVEIESPGVDVSALVPGLVLAPGSAAEIEYDADGERWVALIFGSSSSDVSSLLTSPQFTSIIDGKLSVNNATANNLSVRGFKTVIGDSSAWTLSSGVLTLDLSRALSFDVTVTENITSFVFDNEPDMINAAVMVEVRLRQTGTFTVATGSTAVEWPTSVTYTASSGAGKYDILQFRKGDNIAKWSASIIGQYGAGSTVVVTPSAGEPFERRYIGMMNPGRQGNNIMASTSVNGGRGPSYFVRFTAPVSGDATTFVVNLKYSDTRQGYHVGNGGDLRAELRLNGSNGQPGTLVAMTPTLLNVRTNSTLGWLNAGNGTSSFYEWELYAIDGSGNITANRYSLNAGTVYHVGIFNVASDWENNGVSINMTRNGANQAFINNQHHEYDPQRATFKDGRNGVWSRDQRDTPMFYLKIGTHEIGTPWFEGGATSTNNAPDGDVWHIGGTRRVRQRFTSPYTGTVDRIGVYACRSAGSGALTVKLIQAPSTELKSIDFQDGVNGAAFPIIAPGGGLQSLPSNTPRQGWSARNFNSAASITSGTNYYIELSAPSGTTYWVQTMRDFRSAFATSNTNKMKGRESVPANSGSRFEYSSDSGSNWSVPTYTNMQMPFFLRVASVS